MKLNEINKTVYQPELKPWMYDTKEEIEAWCEKAKIDAHVSKELEIHPVIKDINLHYWSGSKQYELLVQNNGVLKLPVHFYLSGDFSVHSIGLGSMEGLPHTVMGTLEMTDCEITNFVGFPKLVTGTTSGWESDVRITTNKIITSCHGITSINKLEIRAPEILSLEGLPTDLKSLYLGGFKDLKKINEVCPQLEKLQLYTFDSSSGKLKELFNFPKLNGVFLHIDELDGEDTKVLNAMLNKFLPQKDLFGLKETLVNQGLKHLAKLV